MGLAKLEVLFFFVTVQELCVLRQIHASRILLLMQVVQEVHHLRLRPVLVCELDMLVFAPIERKLHVSSGEQIADAILAGMQDSSSPTQYVPLWSTQLEKPKAGHVNVSPFGSSSIEIPTSFI